MLAYDVKQTREKFKHYTRILSMQRLKKSASGITRFQKHKEYGTWFNKSNYLTL